MKIRNILGLMAAAMVLTVSSCNDDDTISKGNYVNDPYMRADVVNYTVQETKSETYKDISGNDSIVTRTFDVEKTRVRNALVCNTGVYGLGAAYNYGFVWSTSNNTPDIYSDNVIYVDQKYPDAVLALQNGVMVDTTAFNGVFPVETPVNVRGFVVTYPEREVIYSTVKKFE